MDKEVIVIMSPDPDFWSGHDLPWRRLRFPNVIIFISFWPKTYVPAFLFIYYSYHCYYHHQHNL